MSVFNIAENKDGRWCAADTVNGKQTLIDVPFITMVEYQQECNAMERALAYWEDFEKKLEGTNPYENLYKSTFTGNIYILPYLSEYHHELSQKWNQGQGPNAENHDGIKVALAKAGESSGWAGVEQPESWAGQNWANFAFSFYLINTYKPDEDIPKNIAFLGTFTTQNMLGRPNAITYVPPCIYDIVIPGIRRCPVGIVKQLRVTNVGAMHAHDVPGIAAKPFIVPDAWRIDITIHETILESREIFNTVFTGQYDKVTAVTGPSLVAEVAKGPGG